MQKDNIALMPELKNVRELLQNGLNQEGLKGVKREDLSDYMRGYKDALMYLQEDIEECFNWTRRGGVSGYVNSLDYDQLCRLLEVANEIKARKDEEEKLVVHRVVMYAGYTENFRQEQLDKAIDCYHKELLKVAKEEDGNIAAIKQVRLVHERVIASEYEEYFS